MSVFKSSTLVAGVAGAVLSLGALSVGGGAEAQGGEKTSAGILLVDGSRFPGVLVGLCEDWIEVESDGMIVQLPWAAVRGDKLLDHRRRAILAGDLVSIENFLLWCRSQGMNKESEEAEIMLRRAGGNPDRVRGWKEPTPPSKEVEVKEPSKRPEQEVEPSKPTPREPSNPSKVSKRKADTWQLVADAKKVSIISEVSEKLESLSGKAVKSKPTLKVELKDYELETVKKAEWFGSIVYIIKKGSVKVILTWSDGHTETTTIKTGDRRSNKNEADANRMVNEDMVTDVWSWIRARAD